MVIGAVAVVTSLATATAIAAGDTDDSLKPASTSFTISNSGNITFKGTINGVPVTVTCTSVTMGAKTRSSGLTADITSDPVFKGCTDSLLGTDTVTSSGTWTLTLIDSTTETQSEPNTGDALQLNIPSGGAKFTSTALPTCTVTANASSPRSSSFNDQNSAAFNGASISVTGSGCSANSTSLSGTFVSSINVGDLTT